MARDHIVTCCCDANGKMIGRTHTKPIFDTRIYKEEFIGGNITEFTTIIIAESMHIQYDADENEFLLIQALVDY